MSIIAERFPWLAIFLIAIQVLALVFFVGGSIYLNRCSNKRIDDIFKKNPKEKGGDLRNVR